MMKTINNVESEIENLVWEFESRVLPKERWTHTAHLTVALWYAANDDFDLALEKMRSGILRLNEAHGTLNTATGGYHETLTVFWMLIVKDFLRQSKSESLNRIAEEIIEKCGRDTPFRFCSRERLFSAEARARFVEPDLFAEDDARQLSLTAVTAAI